MPMRRVGAVCPLTGSQGPSGRDEYRGAPRRPDERRRRGRRPPDPTRRRRRRAATPRPARSTPRRPGSGRPRQLRQHVTQPAAAEAARRHAFGRPAPSVRWPPEGDRFFRVAPSGQLLGAAAVSSGATAGADVRPGRVLAAIRGRERRRRLRHRGGRRRRSRIAALHLPFVGRFRTTRGPRRGDSRPADRGRAARRSSFPRTCATGCAPPPDGSAAAAIGVVSRSLRYCGGPPSA